MKELVQMIDGKAVTTSRKVAEVFEKQHKHVLETIRNLEIPETYREPNFRLTVYEQPNPSGGKPIQQPEYLITRDGFTILAMGFTGKKAMEFKIAYIEAFNEMEKQLQSPVPAICECRSGIYESTSELINKVNLQLLSGQTVDAEILRYAWNVGRLVGKRLSRQVTFPDELESFVMGIASGRFSRNEIYDMYCACTAYPMSARRFWPAVRAIRPCDEVRQAYKRYVVFK
jgi:Rha family phage regulatory protein